MQRRTLPCPARLLSAEHDRQATERWRRSFRFRGNGGGPIRRPNGRSQAAQLAQRMGTRAASWPSVASRTRAGTSRSTGMMITGRAGAQVRRSRRPSRTRICRVARADQMAIVKPSRLGLDHSQRRPTRDEMVDVAPPRHRPPQRRFQRSPARFPQHTADGVLEAPRNAVTARSQERFFASQVTARGPIVAPWNTPTVPTLQQPDPRKL